jgi:hypothetical protein
MQERGATFNAEENLRDATIGAATGVALAEIIGLPRIPVVDLISGIAILNVFGVPLNPMLQAIKDTWKNLRRQA